jgi:PTH2 family peptidyl-tRNA hydrolase
MDPWAVYLVVRKDLPLGTGEAMALAGAGAVRCADRFRSDPRWAEAFRAWSVRPRKVALRASAEEMEALRERLECVAVESEHDDLTLLAFPPRRQAASEPELAALRPYTDPPRRPRGEPRDAAGASDEASDSGDEAADGSRAAGAGDESAGRLVYVIRPGVLRTTGKAMAQAGHAALMCADRIGPRHPEAFAAWREAGAPGEVRVADELAHWAALRESPDTVVVADAGLTQVAPGTETVIGVAPLPEPPPLVTRLRRLD